MENRISIVVAILILSVSASSNAVIYDHRTIHTDFTDGTSTVAIEFSGTDAIGASSYLSEELEGLIEGDTATLRSFSLTEYHTILNNVADSEKDTVVVYGEGVGASPDSGAVKVRDKEDIPEPATMLLMGTSILSLAGLRKKLRKR